MADAPENSLFLVGRSDRDHLSPVGEGYVTWATNHRVFGELEFIRRARERLEWAQAENRPHRIEWVDDDGTMYKNPVRVFYLVFDNPTDAVEAKLRFE